MSKSEGIDRLPPQNIEAEEAVLGGLLIDSDAIIRVSTVLKPEDFYREKNGWIFRPALALHERHEPIDFLTVCDELERMGDYAKGIARINLMIGEQPPIKPLIDLPVMATKAREMLHAALVAFVERDVHAARSIPKGDDEIDALYNQVYRELMALVIAQPNRIEQSNYTGIRPVTDQSEVFGIEVQHHVEPGQGNTGDPTQKASAGNGFEPHPVILDPGYGIVVCPVSE